MPPARWLLLVHQTPSRPVALRMRVWRRLQRIGAVALKSTVYALPSRVAIAAGLPGLQVTNYLFASSATLFNNQEPCTLQNWERKRQEGAFRIRARLPRSAHRASDPSRSLHPTLGS